VEEWKVLSGTFRKIAKSDYKLRHVCPLAWNNSRPHWSDFHEIWYLGFSKILEKIEDA
jgi:hypothetical protein